MSEETLTVTQVAQALGVSRMTIHRRVKEGRLKPVNATGKPLLDRGANLRFRKSDIDQLLNSAYDQESSFRVAVA